MKSTKTHTLLIALFAFVCSVFAHKQVFAQPQVAVSFDLFYNELSPYGHWDRHDNYGDIWFPRAEANFRPYGTNGYWAMTEYGNTWVSEYDWGWAPFHYGRWVYTNHRGWGWIPGYEWGPAWVDWRSGGGYYGWAPMAPAVGLTVSVGLPINLWVFLPTRRIYDRHIHRHWSHGHRNIYNRTTIINNTYIVNNNRYYGGPARRDIERHIGRRVAVRNIRTTDRPGRSKVDNRSVSIYRPDRAANTRINQKATRVTEANRRPSATTNRANNSRPERYIGNNPSRANESRATRNNTTPNRTQNQRATPNNGNRPTTGNREARATQRESRANEQRTNVNRSSTQRNQRATQPRSPQSSSRTAQQRSEANRRPAAQPQQNNRGNVQRTTPSRSQSPARSSRPARQSAPTGNVYQTSQRSSSPARVNQSRSNTSNSSRVQRSSSSSRSSGTASRSGNNNRSSSARGSR